jgi:hypothetical protein
MTPSQSKIAARCAQNLPSGASCFHDATACPFHEPPELPSSPLDAVNPPLEPAVTLPKVKLPSFAERRNNAVDPRTLADEMLQRVLSGAASPVQAGRFVRATRTVSAMPPPQTDEETALAEAEFRGRIRNGLPPMGDEEWNYARLRFTEEAVKEFARWAVLLDAPYPDDIEPAGGRTRAEAKTVTEPRPRQQPEPTEPNANHTS